MKAILVQLVNIMLRLLPAGAKQEAFAFMMHLHHVLLCLFFGPAKHHLKNAGNEIHEIDRVIPTDDPILRIEILNRLRLNIRTWKAFWFFDVKNGLVHHFVLQLRQLAKLQVYSSGSAQFDEQIFAFHRVTDLHQHFRDSARGWRIDRGLHFHGFKRD